MCIYLHQLCDISVLFLSLEINFVFSSICFFFSGFPMVLSFAGPPLKKTTDHLPRCGSSWDPTSLASSKADVFFWLRKGVDS